jgi:hypothetical protein
MKKKLNGHIQKEISHAKKIDFRAKKKKKKSFVTDHQI